MKKILVSATLAVLALPVFAGTKTVFGSTALLDGEKNIPVTLDWKEAVYANGGDINDFLLRAPRDENWESKSLAYFLKEANEKVLEYGIRLVPADAGDNAKYRIVISPSSISKSGDIKGEILIMPVNGNDPLTSVAFSSDERDDDDKIAFRDQLENIGENFGKLIKKEIKAQRKAK